MKLLVILLCICYFSTIKAVPGGRDKRATGLEYCSFDTDEECITYVENKNKVARENGQCIKYNGYKGDRNYTVRHFTCGVIICPDGFYLEKEDPSKPYPDCCHRKCINSITGKSF